MERPEILERVVQDYAALYGGTGRGDALRRKIGAGQTRWVFGVGQLSSGLWLAHKVWIGRGDSGSWTLEKECQLAERYFEQGEKVPFFTMIVKHNDIGSILTEDITHGRTLRIYSDELDFVWIQPAEGKGGRMKVYTDFKHTFGGHSDWDYKYSSEEAVLAV